MEKSIFMWLKHFPIKGLADVIESLRTVFIFNTLEEKNGQTLYDLTQIIHLPHSKIYREMNRLHDEGYLTKQEQQNPLGRPKYVFNLSDKGRAKREELKAELKKTMQFLKERFPEQSDFDEDAFLCKATLALWQDPISRILGSDKTNAEKLEILAKVQEDITERLSTVEAAIEKLRAEALDK